jgi:hypothetical protein
MVEKVSIAVILPQNYQGTSIAHRKDAKDAKENQKKRKFRMGRPFPVTTWLKSRRSDSILPLRFLCVLCAFAVKTLVEGVRRQINP